MSSSNVIKTAHGQVEKVNCFSFESFRKDTPLNQASLLDGFKPLFTIAKDLNSEVDNSSHQYSDPGSELVAVKHDIGDHDVKLIEQNAYDEGFADGRREAEESFIKLCQALSEAISAVTRLREQLVSECEADLLNLSIMVAKQIIRQEVTMNKSILAQFVSEAIAGISDQGDLVICFNPQDYQDVSANRSFYLSGIGDKAEITLKSDDSVSVGGCIVETQTGQVDATLETQLSNVFKRLMEENGRSSDDAIEALTDTQLNIVEQYGAQKYASQQHKP